MSIVLDGTTGITTPGLTNTGSTTIVALTTTGNTTLGDASTDTLNVGNGGLIKDASGNVAIGMATPTGDANRIVSIAAAGGSGFFMYDTNQGSTVNDGSNIQVAGTNLYIYNKEAGFVAFGQNNAEKARIDSSGNLLVGTTTTPASGGLGVLITGTQGANFWESRCNTTAGYGHLAFYNPNGQRGEIQTNGTNLLLVNNSDYRLKENVAPMVGALSKVAQLKPCTYTWKVDGSSGQGFIAHELQAVVPDCVSGEKDAINEDGSIKPQGIDTSFLVATLTAAIQEQQALITQLTARITALENK